MDTFEPNFKVPFNQIRESQKQILKNLCVLLGENLKICEVGSWVGESTAVFADYVKNHGGQVTCVDWWKGNEGTVIGEIAERVDPYQIFLENLKGLDLLPYLKILKGDSVEMSQTLKDDSFDLVFIDADHRYSGLSRDIKAYFPKVKLGGIICGHDCEGREWIEEYVEIDYVAGKHHGAIKAVYENFPECEICESIWSLKKGEKA